MTFPVSGSAERSRQRISPLTLVPDGPVRTANERPTACRVEQVRSRDRDQARDLVATYFTPHGLDVLGSPANLDVHLRTRRTSSITLGDLHYGTEVIIRPTRVPTYYKINIPVRGCSVSVFGADEVESYPGQAAVLTPIESFTMRWRGDCDVMTVSISTEVVERTLEAVLGYPPEEAVRFAVRFDLRTGAGLRWLRSVAMLRDALDEGAPDLVVRPLEDLVVGQLLTAQPHSFTARLSGAPRPARPRTLARVLRRIEADPAASHTLSDLARTAGTSVRSLQAAFADHLGMSPSAYVRRVRLARAHQELLAAEPGDGRSVADVAYQWGFGHVPRFAAAYRERYGVPPSQTLRS
ncbi:MAG: AraC family transcriptional regulator [Pseudonocardia sp.]